MKAAGLHLVFLHVYLRVSLPVEGKPLLTVSVTVFAGKDGVLPCGVGTPVDVSHATLEWSRVDGPSPLTLFVLRDGEELEKEKAPDYRGRTSLVEHGSLKLLGVTWRDSGTYRCVLEGGTSQERDVYVSLTVVQVLHVNFPSGRTSANELIAVCEPGDWSQKSLASLLAGESADVPHAQKKASVRADGPFSVRVLVNQAAVMQTGKGTLNCEVEPPGRSLANENKISISDEFNPQQTQPAYVTTPVILLCVLLFVVVFVPVGMIVGLRHSVQPLTGCVTRLITKESEGQKDEEDEDRYTEYGNIELVETRGASEDTARAGRLSGTDEEDEDRYTEYGNIELVETRGASEDTARAGRLSGTGPEVSNKLAENDLQEMLKYKKDIVYVGNSLCIHPALIAAIISRQSQAGTRLKPSGFGESDNDSYGLMQINKCYHAVKGSPFSREHLDQGVTFLIQLIKTMERTKPDWNKEQRLKGALACYISGEDRVIPLTYGEVDSVTPRGDFCSDVVARAQWFRRNGF